MKTFKKLWGRIKDLEISGFYSDYWKSYAELILSETHMESKAEIFTVEGYSARIRHYLVRFERKSKCYSKEEHMEKSL